MSTKALVTQSYEIPALSGALGDAMQEEMNGLDIRLDRAKIPSGGALAFELPGDDPDSPDSVKELTGVIVDHYPLNCYWKEKYSGQNVQPDCISIDRKPGEGSPGGDCAFCHFNRFGSADDGNGKACKNMHALFLLHSGELLPIALTLPPTSLHAFSDYLGKRVVAKGLRSFGVVTRITLRKVANASGIPYSQAQFAIIERLDSEATETMRRYAEQARSMTRRERADELVFDAETGEVMMN